MSANRNCAFLCLAAIVCGFVRTCHAQAYAATPDPDAPFKLLTQKWGQALADLTVTVLAHNGTNKTALAFTSGSFSACGETKMLSHLSRRKTRRSVGKELYQTQLQNFGKGLQSFYDAAAANANTPKPGKWLDFILRTVRDINLAKQVVANHDTSPKCLALAKVLGQRSF
ncbi:hypothetical protein BV898_19285 [Hypsibius exemplaris]|uniref:Uncharacterized protein n=1 Tax=Hypsibius exemplaris TaxID=2072580 RepID=A0A9X6NLC8_HYPEX|nr:hypothetical protein BV898_19285 [Hypsibius exemplaris]